MVKDKLQGFPVIENSSDSANMRELLQGDTRWCNMLKATGGVLFRGFGVNSVAKMEALLPAMMKPTPEFEEETSPRTSLGSNTFTSTDYPAKYPIQFHNEFSYRKRMPELLAFACVRAPKSGGATPIADTREVITQMRPDTLQRFEREGILYTRNFVGFGVPWERAFGRQDRVGVEAYCRANHIEFRWSDRGLHTAQRGPAIVVDPVTGDRAWCNHALNFNVLGVEPRDAREALVGMPDELKPTNSYYGSGAPISAEVIREIRDAYEAVARRFTWRTGDVLLVDNVLTAHARDPYEGERQVVVGMGDRRCESH